MTDTAAPITRSERITNLDTVRGIATLGILIMNAVSFGLPQPAYFNLDYAGSNTTLDWIVGVLGELFERAKPTGQGNEGIGVVVHPRLPLVHRADLLQRGESLMADLLGEEPGWDHAGDGSTRLEDSVGDEPHQPDGATCLLYTSDAADE